MSFCLFVCLSKRAFGLLAFVQHRWTRWTVNKINDDDDDDDSGLMMTIGSRKVRSGSKLLT